MDYWNHRVTSNNTGCPTATKQKANVTKRLLDISSYKLFVELFVLFLVVEETVKLLQTNFETPPKYVPK